MNLNSCLMVKIGDITIARIHLELGLSTDHVRNFKILRFIGRTNDNGRTWMGRLKNSKPVFIRKYKSQTYIQNIINW